MKKILSSLNNLILAAFIFAFHVAMFCCVIGFIASWGFVKPVVFFIAQAFFDLMRLIREKKDDSGSANGNKKQPTSSKDKKDKKSKRKCTIL